MNVRLTHIYLYGYLCGYVNIPKSFFFLCQWAISSQDSLHTEILMEEVSGKQDGGTHSP